MSHATEKQCSAPTGGFGTNTDMGDAVDLGWKLEASLRGWGGPRLLDSYDLERRPIGERAVREATVNFRNLKSLPTYPWIETMAPKRKKSASSSAESS